MGQGFLVSDPILSQGRVSLCPCHTKKIQKKGWEGGLELSFRVLGSGLSASLPALPLPPNSQRADCDYDHDNVVGPQKTLSALTERCVCYATQDKRGSQLPVAYEADPMVSWP